MVVVTTEATSLLRLAGWKLPIRQFLAASLGAHHVHRWAHHVLDVAQLSLAG